MGWQVAIVHARAGHRSQTALAALIAALEADGLIGQSEGSRRTRTGDRERLVGEHFRLTGTPYGR